MTNAAGIPYPRRVVLRGELHPRPPPRGGLRGAVTVSQPPLTLAQVAAPAPGWEKNQRALL